MPTTGFPAEVTMRIKPVPPVTHDGNPWSPFDSDLTAAGA